MKPQLSRFAVWSLVLAALLAGCGKKKADAGTERPGGKPAAEKAIHVVTAVVRPGSFEDWGVYSADLRGAEDAVLTAPAPSGGRVNSVAEVGRAVSRGEALCDIDGERYHAALLQAQSAVELAKGERDRTRSNVENGYVGKAMLDKAELDYQGAVGAALQAERAYENSRCQAPFAGVLASRFVDRFQSVAPGVPTVRVADLSRLEAVVSLPESEAFDYREGQRAEFQLLDGEHAAAPGRIRGLDRAVEARNRTVTARIDLSNPGGRLRPGLVGKVRILRKSYEGAVVVPSQAILRLQEGTLVMRVAGDEAQKAPVTLGPASGDSVLILSGLSAGDRIITVGGFQVSAGTKVEF
jgi:membrane fusion protein (multidrug efflux system)